MKECFVEDTVVIGKNVKVEPFAVVKGNSVLHDGCVVGSFSHLENAEIGVGTIVNSSRVVDSFVGNGCIVGPNAHLRENTYVGDCCRIGDFVEIKNSTLGKNVKASHLAYVGDATVGDGTNIGCGVVFVNFDGKQKHKTQVGKNCFIGCNVNLVAPLTVGKNCFVACGTTVDRNVCDGAFVIGRSRLTVKEERAQSYLPQNK